jgi:hypothetical protein
MFERLVEFKPFYGHVNVPKNFQKWGLGIWVKDQRTVGRNGHKNGQLDPRRARRLLEIGMDFDYRWKENFEKLKAHKKKNSHCRVVTASPDVQDAQFLAWVHNQRVFREKGMLLPKRETKLDGIGFVWQAPNVNNIGEDEQDGVAETERGDLHRVGSDNDEQNESKAFGNLGDGFGESDASDEVFEFEG